MADIKISRNWFCKVDFCAYGCCFHNIKRSVCTEVKKGMSYDRNVPDLKLEVGTYLKKMILDYGDNVFMNYWMRGSSGWFVAAARLFSSWRNANYKTKILLDPTLSQVIQFHAKPQEGVGFLKNKYLNDVHGGVNDFIKSTNLGETASMGLGT